MTVLEIVVGVFFIVMLIVDWFVLAKITYVKWANAIVIPMAIIVALLYGLVVFG